MLHQFRTRKGKSRDFTFVLLCVALCVDTTTPSTPSFPLPRFKYYGLQMVSSCQPHILIKVVHLSLSGNFTVWHTSQVTSRFEASDERALQHYCTRRRFQSEWDLIIALEVYSSRHSIRCSVAEILRIGVRVDRNRKPHYQLDNLYCDHNQCTYQAPLQRQCLTMSLIQPFSCCSAFTASRDRVIYFFYLFSLLALSS